MGYDSVTTPCPSCLTNLKMAEHKMHKDEFRSAVNDLLDVPYQGGVETKSVLQVLIEGVGADRVADAVKTSLEGIKVACYYGCSMTRPPEVMDFDDPEHPMAMDQLMEACGAEVVAYPLKVECCGASFGSTRKDIVAKLSGKLLSVAEALEVDALVTACPLCHLNLDLRQVQINMINKTRYQLPVFYFTQLMGLALGLDKKTLGLKKLAVNPEPVLAKLG